MKTYYIILSGRFVHLIPKTDVLCVLINIRHGYMLFKLGLRLTL